MTTESPPLVGTSALYVSRPINKKEGIINKVFVDMLDKHGLRHSACLCEEERGC